jgi:deoxyribodipyrimidine photolyase-related protein
LSVANIILPNQLFKNILLPNKCVTFLVEEHLFFNEVNFHKQKLAYHRATLKFYESFLIQKSFKINYIEAHTIHSDIRNLIAHLSEKNINTINLYRPEDNWLTKRISSACKKHSININWHENLLFINSEKENENYFKVENKKFHQTTFYKSQRKKLEILINDNNTPVGGKWTFDNENRKKYPSKLSPPKTVFCKNNNYKLAVDYVQKYFPNNIGELDPNNNYPINYDEADKWLMDFFKIKFNDFGIYEDAIVKDEIFLNHSVISPMLNIGLLEPINVLDQALSFGKKYNIPINSIEGFVRQLIGWREFIRGIYHCKGNKQRTTNFWNFKREIPASFYDGTTGIDPIDDTIKKVLKTGYCHHIERLMIISNFMMLCEFNPDSVYRWFMELFIDAYDWVMVPNVYGMSLYADGGLMTTKPYISSSNYIIKMSNYKKGEWQETWDGLFWRFMNKHRNFFLKNPRMGMLIRTFDKMDETKRNTLIQNGNDFINKLN